MYGPLGGRSKMDAAARHHEVHLPKHADVGERIAADGDDVGDLSGLDRARLADKAKAHAAIHCLSFGQALQVAECVAVAVLVLAGPLQ